jgi:hypothetical protein
MSKLLERLKDPSRSGVYRARGDRTIAEVVQGSGLRLARVRLEGGKEKTLERIAAALRFPNWFGGNWDALEDALGDLSWLDAGGHVIVFDGEPPEAMLLEILRDCAEAWKARGAPFFAVFLDPAQRVGLPDLYRE